MRFQSLQTRFLLTGGFLVLITVAGGAWSVFTLIGLSATVGENLRESRATIDLTASLADLLEREDDALLLALSGKIRNARSEVARQRQDFDEAYNRLRNRPLDPAEQEAARALQEHTVAYRVVGDALLRQADQPGIRESQETIDAAAGLADLLEREDDALLLALTGNITTARSEVAKVRQDVDKSYAALMASLRERKQLAVARALGEHRNSYGARGDALLRQANTPKAREVYHRQVNPALRKAVADCTRLRELSFRAIQRGVQARDAYHEQVNPALRKAVADCDRIRELNFDAMQQVGVLASNDTRRAAGIVAGIALIALGLSTVVMVRLAQGILRPVRQLTRSMEAIRQDDFTCRVEVSSADELGQLAQGFNRMAETLGDYRQSSLGELLLAKATLEATLAALPDAVIVVDPDGQIVSKNPLAVKILETLGGPAAARVADLQLPKTILDDVNEALRNGQTKGARPDLSQALLVSVNGRRIKVLVTVVPIREFLPRRAGAAIVLADVTEFARLDELRSEVVAVASHELKTPLTALQMNLMMLQEKADNLSARQREVLSAAVHGGAELGGIIDELLDLTRIEAGQLRVEQQRVDLRPLLEHVARTLGPRFEDAEVKLRVVQDIPEAIVKGDAARLKLVFMNLLSNALKYTPRKGEVVVRVASLQNAVEPGKSRLQITVTDTGPGVPAELRQRVFEKFFRVEDERADGPKGVRGTGIGLYLSREIIEAHGGTIACTAGEDQRGTRIAITLDRDESQTQPASN
jgi:NtrC-family two-component system sensor histidine kinase KinB